MPKSNDSVMKIPVTSEPSKQTCLTTLSQPYIDENDHSDIKNHDVIGPCLKKPTVRSLLASTVI